jgi:hypothetical protein
LFDEGSSGRRCDMRAGKRSRERHGNGDFFTGPSSVVDLQQTSSAGRVDQ